VLNVVQDVVAHAPGDGFGAARRDCAAEKAEAPLDSGQHDEAARDQPEREAVGGLRQVGVDEVADDQV